MTLFFIRSHPGFKSHALSFSITKQGPHSMLPDHIVRTAFLLSAAYSGRVNAMETKIVLPGPLLKKYAYSWYKE